MEGNLQLYTLIPEKKKGLKSITWAFTIKKLEKEESTKPTVRRYNKDQSRDQWTRMKKNIKTKKSMKSKVNSLERSTKLTNFQLN